jgi:hypothetical protein
MNALKSVKKSIDQPKQRKHCSGSELSKSEAKVGWVIRTAKAALLVN